MWMNGPVGTGKSAIAQNVAHLAAERGQLSSAFFFRSDNTRSSTTHLVPTLVYEMTQQIPHTLDSVRQTISTNPLVFSSSLDCQIHSVLLPPLKIPFKSSRPCKLVIIDGLDECPDTGTQREIIQSFISSFLSASTEIIPHKLLIVSRPEPQISGAFLAFNIRPHVKHLSLESRETEDDIEIFLRDKLREIKDTYPHHLPDIWPDEGSFRELQKRSAGSFAYASAVIRFLSSRKDHPQRALQGVLSVRPRRVTAAFTELDALYRHILLCLEPNICFTVQKVLCLYLYDRCSVPLLAAGLSEEQSLVEITLTHVPSLIWLNHFEVRFHHRSFEEFVRDKERSGEHCVFSPHVVDAVITALSKLWLQPAHDRLTYAWFSNMGRSIQQMDCEEIDVHILRALTATKIGPNILSLTHDVLEFAITQIVEFFKCIRLRVS